MGPTHLQNFLAECNLPSITESTLRKKEKELSGQIKNVTIQSCNMAQREEKSLSTNGNVSIKCMHTKWNIQTICLFLENSVLFNPPPQKKKYPYIV